MTEKEPQSRHPTSEEQDSRASEPQPTLRIINGDATAEEVAAIVAVLASFGSAAEPPARRTPEWSAQHRKVRVTLPHGLGGWRSSSLPR